MSGEFCPPSSHYPEEGEEIIVEGLATANRVIQREGRVESTLPKKKPETGARAAARQCLPTGEGERSATATAFGEPGRLWVFSVDLGIKFSRWCFCFDVNID